MRTSRALAKQIVAAYAGVLYDAASADDSVDAVSVQLEAVQRLVRGSGPLRDVLLDDAVAEARRAQVAREVFSGLYPALIETLVVMAERGNFDLLSGVVEKYGEIGEERRGVVEVDVTTAVELTESLRQAIQAKFSADLGKGIVLREKVDPAIVGGIVISTHGRRIDASISSQLEAARVVLSTAPTGGEA
jgi:F-type H+-transporting ATPase subunit delta